MASTTTAGMEALHSLKSTEPPVWLAPDPKLSKTARAASQHLFSSLKPFATKSPFDHLLIDGFDAEQIWQQIDLQSQPLLSSLRREVKKLEKNPEEIKKLKQKQQGVVQDQNKKKVLEENNNKHQEGIDYDDDDDDGLDMDMDGFDDDDEVAENESEEEEEEEEEREGGIEDKFLKIKELQEYLEDDEAKEYGLKSDDNKVEDDDDEDELGMFGDEDDEDEDEDANELENARYEDFFGSKNKKVSKRKSKLEEDSSSGDEEEEGNEEEEDDEMVENKKKDVISTHEKQLAKRRSEIEQMEKANLEPKTWTMSGEATAAERPKNSALEVELDFEHNMRPAPVITEEVTASLEDIIQKRILEGRFDDVQKAPSIASKAPRELKELDENKSKKGLAEIYEKEYLQKTDPASAPLTFSDEQKKEASMLFKKLCLKLDALSHFHFAPKPVIEDMSIQANVPALAMEEIAPVAVSDAAMLAPEEVFSGKGDIKEEVELSQAERKRRRANKKRKFKAVAAKRMAKKPRDNTLLNHNDGKEES